MKCSLEWSLELCMGNSLWEGEKENSKRCVDSEKNRRGRTQQYKSHTKQFLFRLDRDCERFSLVREKKTKTKWRKYVSEKPRRAEPKLDDAVLRYDIYMGDVYANRFHVPNNVSSVSIVIVIFSYFSIHRLMTVENKQLNS